MRNLGRCTAVRKAGPCVEQATRRRVLVFHRGPVCEACYRRIYRQNTVECSGPGCTVRLYPRSKKGRTVPAPWCRRDEHRALSAEVLGQSGREAARRAFVTRIEPDWETGCWVWTGKVREGYGRYRSRITGEWVAHRMGWHLFHEGHKIGQELDHRHGGGYGGGGLCVSPLHLQPVTPGRNIELRELRRADPLGHWYREGEAGSVHLPLLVFTMSNGLPLKTPELDYSAQWEPVSTERPAVDRPAQPATVPAVPEEEQAPPLDLSGLPISERTARDLKLSPSGVEQLRDRPRVQRRKRR